MKIRGFIRKVVVIAMISTCVFPVGAAPSIKDLQDKKLELKSKSEKERANIKSYEDSKKDLENQIKGLDKKIEEISDELEKLDQQMTGVSRNIAEKNRKIKEEKKEISLLVQELKTKIKFIYENSDRGELQSLLDSEDVSDILNKREYVGSIYNFDQEKIDRLKKLIHANRSAKKDLEATKDTLSELKKKHQKQQDEVNEVLQDKQKDIDEFEGKIKDAKLKEKEYLSDIEEQDKIIEALEAAALKRRQEKERKEREERKKEEEKKKKALQQAKTVKEETTKQETKQTSVTSSGDLVWPCPGYRRISSGYGPRRHPTLKIRKMHNGIDIPAPVGTPIVAAKSGEVMQAGYNSTMGNYVIIDHGGGLTTIYMHCSKLKVRSGADVKEGQTIATVGSTGRSTGAHLHFGAKMNGAYVNPLKYLK